RLDLGGVGPGPAGAGRARQDLARALVPGGDAAGPGGRAVLRRGPDDRLAVVGVLRPEARHLRPAAAGGPGGGPPHVPVLRRQRGARLRRLAADVGAGGGVGAGDGPPGAGAVARLRLAVAGGPADAGALARGAVALVAARPRARAAVGAVRRP